MTHAQPTVAVMPLDDRAVNYEYVVQLGMAAGFAMRLPPKEWLGTPWRAGDMAQLAAWLRDAALDADALIVSCETLGYGGLVNSRRATESADTVLARLALLRELKEARPELTILAYSVLLRISRHDGAEEEKPYWAEFGARIFRMSVIEDRLAMAVAAPDEVNELAALRAAIPVELVADYRAGRARNHAVNRAMIGWTADGVFDYLIVPQDDTVDYGWNIAEGRALRRLVQRQGLSDRVSIYPGADETDMLLLARYAATRAGFQPKAWLYTSGANAGQIITAFEDRSMIEMAKAHLAPLGGVVVQTPAEADILLYINAPAEVQGNGPDQYALLLEEDDISLLPPAARQALLAYRARPENAATLRELYSVGRNLPEFAANLRAALEAGHSCIVVDVAYVNAGDQALGDLLVAQTEVSQLAAYAGWNTAGNTLGSALAQGIIRHLQRLHGATPEQLKAHVGLLFLRLVEDYLFMSRLRSRIMLEALPALGVEPTLANLGAQADAVEALVGDHLRTAADALAAARFAGRNLAADATTLQINKLTLTDVTLPWGRLFDVTLAATVDGEA